MTWYKFLPHNENDENHLLNDISTKPKMSFAQTMFAVSLVLSIVGLNFCTLISLIIQCPVEGTINLVFSIIWLSLWLHTL